MVNFLEAMQVYRNTYGQFARSNAGGPKILMVLLAE